MTFHHEAVSSDQKMGSTMIFMEHSWEKMDGNVWLRMIQSVEAVRGCRNWVLIFQKDIMFPMQSSCWYWWLLLFEHMEHSSSGYTWLYVYVYKGKSRLEISLEIPLPSEKRYISFRTNPLFNKLEKWFSYSW